MAGASALTQKNARNEEVLSNMSKRRQGNPCGQYRFEGRRLYLRDTRAWVRLLGPDGDGKPSPRPLS
jgi:hypothetical protein